MAAPCANRRRWVLARTRWFLPAALVVLLLCGWPFSGGAAAAEPGSGDPGRVVVVVLTGGSVSGITGLPTWRNRVAGVGAVALMNSRVEGRVVEPVAALVSLGAGQRAVPVPDLRIESTPDGARVDGVESLVSANRQSRFGAEPGALAAGLARRPGFIGVATTDRPEPGSVGDPLLVALAAMGPDGIAEGRVVAPEAVAGALAEDRHAVTFVGLPVSGPEATDRHLAAVLDATAGAEVMIVAPATGDAAFGVFALLGRGDGAASSSSTRRSGFVSLVDPAGELLHRTGRSRPPSMIDARIEVHDTRVDLLALQQRAQSRQDTWVALTVILGALATFAGVAVGFRRRALGAALGAATWCLLTVDLVGRGVGAWRLPAWALVAMITTVALGVAVGARPWRGGRARRVLVAAAGGYLGVVSVDLVAGLGWQDDGTWGNSSMLGATSRFVGIGNLAFALAATATIVVLVAAADRAPADRAPADRAATDRAPADRAATDRPMLRGRWAAGAVVVVAWFLLLDGAPGWGADVGGMLAGVPGFALLLWALSGRGFSWRLPVIGGLATLLMLGGLALVDGARPPADRTHLTRFLTGGSASRTFRRKFDSNLDIILRSWWWVLVIVVVVGAAVRWWPAVREALAEVVARHPAVTVAAWPVATFGALTLVLNDSGFSPPAMGFALIAAALAVLSVDAARPRDRTG